MFEGVGNGALYHVTNLVVGFHIFALVMGLWGLGRAIKEKHPWALAIGLSFVAYFILIARAEVLFLRYTFPLYPALALGFAVFVGRLHERQGLGRVGVAMAFLAVGAQATSTVSITTEMMGEDARDRICRLIRSLSNESTVVGLVNDPWFYTPPFFPDSAMMRGANGLQSSEMRAITAPRVVCSFGKSWDKHLLMNEPDFIVLSSFEVGDVDRLRAKKIAGPEVDAFMEFDEIVVRDYNLIVEPEPKNPEPYRLARSMILRELRS